jgi:hypothetical protein
MLPYSAPTPNYSPIHMMTKKVGLDLMQLLKTWGTEYGREYVWSVRNGLPVRFVWLRP